MNAAVRGARLAPTTLDALGLFVGFGVTGAPTAADDSTDVCLDVGRVVVNDVYDACGYDDLDYVGC